MRCEKPTLLKLFYLLSCKLSILNDFQAISNFWHFMTHFKHISPDEIQAYTEDKWDFSGGKIMQIIGFGSHHKLPYYDKCYVCLLGFLQPKWSLALL